MRKFYAIAVVIAALVFVPRINARNISAEALSNAIQVALPTEFGYVDSTDYLMKHEFSSLCGIFDSHVVVCADSANFNEFGVFFVKNTTDIKPCIKQLSEYLNNRKTQFQSGVVYNPAEYPKFESAKVFSVGPVIISTILDPSQGAIAEKTVKEMLK